MSEIELLRAENGNLRQDLNDARNGWESAVEAIRTADEALALADTVQGLLVDALQGFVAYASNPTVNIGQPQLVSAARAALAAAGVTP